MHELSIAEGIVRGVVDYFEGHFEGRLEGERVLRVRVQVGRLAAVLPDAMRFCFDLCARNTLLEGAELELIAVAARGRCRSCGREGELPGGPRGDLALCPCGSADVELHAGNELRILDVEVG